MSSVRCHAPCAPKMGWAAICMGPSNHLISWWLAKASVGQLCTPPYTHIVNSCISTFACRVYVVDVHTAKQGVGAQTKTKRNIHEAIVSNTKHVCNCNQNVTVNTYKQNKRHMNKTRGRCGNAPTFPQQFWFRPKVFFGAGCMASPDCCLCSECVNGPQSDEVAWACGHKVHLECFGSWVHSTWPELQQPPLPDGGLPCALCRSPWHGNLDDVLAAKLRIVGKTFQDFVDHVADQEMVPPPPPASPAEWIVPLCCPRLLATGDGDGEPTFVEIEYDRRMTWLGGVDYECLRCGSKVSNSMPVFNYLQYIPSDIMAVSMSACNIHGRRSMIVDMQTNLRWWTCIERYPEDDVPMPLQHGCNPIGPYPIYGDYAGASDTDPESNHSHPATFTWRSDVSRVSVIDVDAIDELPEPAGDMEIEPQPEPADDEPRPQPAEEEPRPQPAEDEQPIDESSRRALLHVVCADELDALSRLARDD